MNTKLDDAFVWKYSLRLDFTQYESDHKSFIYIYIYIYIYNDTKTCAYLIQNVLLFHPQFLLLGEDYLCPIIKAQVDRFYREFFKN